MSAARVRLHYYTKKGKLIHIHKGLYAKDQNYDKYELGVKILKPAYISFETVLTSAGIIFQYYSQIFVASYITRKIICDHQKYSFCRIKKETLINPKGIDVSGEYSVASAERAFLDTIYRSGNYYFDNLSPLDWEKVFDLLPVYNNKAMEKKVNLHYKSFK